MSGPDSSRLSLRFRPLRLGDLGAVHVLHSDPLTNLHNPYGASPDEAASQAMLADWLEHWGKHGFGYELAFSEDRLAGIEGARRDIWRGSAVLNLYWRLLPSFQGAGLSGVMARRALSVAKQAKTEELIVARMQPENTASAHVAQRLGLHRREDLDDVHDGFHWVVYATGW